MPSITKLKNWSHFNEGPELVHNARDMLDVLKINPQTDQYEKECGPATQASFVIYSRYVWSPRAGANPADLTNDPARDQAHPKPGHNPAASPQHLAVCLTKKVKSASQ